MKFKIYFIIIRISNSENKNIFSYVHAVIVIG